MQKFFGNDKFTDFSIKVENQIIKTHKIILSQIDYFYILFNNEFKDSKIMLELNDISYKNFIIFIKVLYGIYEKIDNIDDAVEFLCQTKKFMAFHLFKPILKCLINIQDNIRLELDLEQVETVIEYFICNKIEIPLPFNYLFTIYSHEFNFKLICDYLTYYNDIDQDICIKIIINTIEHNKKLSDNNTNELLDFLPKNPSILKILLLYNIKNPLLINFTLKLFRIKLSNDLIDIIPQKASKKCAFENCTVQTTDEIKFGDKFCENHSKQLDKHSHLFNICKNCDKYISTFMI